MLRMSWIILCRAGSSSWSPAVPAIVPGMQKISKRKLDPKDYPMKLNEKISLKIKMKLLCFLKSLQQIEIMLTSIMRNPNRFFICKIF